MYVWKEWSDLAARNGNYLEQIQVSDYSEPGLLGDTQIYEAEALVGSSVCIIGISYTMTSRNLYKFP